MHMLCVIIHNCCITSLFTTCRAGTNASKHMIAGILLLEPHPILFITFYLLIAQAFIKASKHGYKQITIIRNVPPVAMQFAPFNL